jgi:glycosyltransferase involved in cell wall biosynthesis
MLFSIITPSYNQGKFIEETILSALQQNVDIEHIIIDGGSTDETLSILKKYSHIRWISEPDKGQADAINRGFRMAKGDILAYLCSDDLYTQDSLQLVLQYFENHNDAKIIYGNCEYINAFGRSTGIMFQTGKYKTSKLFEGNLIAQPSCFWKREVLKKIGALNDKLHYTMDYEFWLRISQHFTFNYIPYTLSKYRLHQNSKTVTHSEKSVLETLAILHEWYTREDLNILIKSIIKNAYAKNLLRHAILMLDKNRNDAKKELKNALVYQDDIFKQIEYYARFYLRSFGINGEKIFLTHLRSKLLNFKSEIFCR